MVAELHNILSARLSARLDTSAGLDGCHAWLGAHDPKGYPRMKWDGKNDRVHRLVAVAAGKIMPGSDIHILHRCDNPGCCNERHFAYGTNGDNVADRVRKDRSAKGERNGNHRSRRS